MLQIIICNLFCLQDDKKLWLSSSAGAAELDIEMSCFLLREIGDQFCELLQQEKEAESHHLNDGKYSLHCKLLFVDTIVYL